MSTNVGEIDLSLILNSDKFRSQLNNVNSQADSAAAKLTKTLSKIGKAVGVAFSVAAVVKFGKECVNVATETSNAWIGLNSILTGQGKSFSQAQKFIQEYVSDGLIPLNNAVAAYKNLASRGYNTEQIQKTMEALKNASVYGRQSSYTMGEAVQSATEGLKNENSILVDNAGVTKNVAKMWEDYAKSVGKSTNQLTQAEKIQAEYNGILEETKFQMHDAETAQNTFTGKVSTLSQAFTNMKVAIGNVIQPIAKLLIPVLTSAANAVTRLFTAIAGLMSMFGLKADSVETVSKGLGGVAENADKAADAVKGVGDNASKTGKQAKKAALQLAGFDEMNKLTDNSSSGSGGGSGGGAGGGTSALAESFDVTTNIEQDTSAFDGLLGRVKELAGIFKEGFDISFGDTNFDGILTSLNNIKNTILDIWTDPEVIGAANNYINAVIYSWGQTIGAVARIGINIAEGLLGSIDLYLSSNKDRIKNTLIQIFDLKAEWQRVSGNFYQALGEISDVFKSDSAKQIGANIIAMFANPIMSVSLLFQKFTNDIQALLLQPVIDNVKKLKTTFLNIQKPVQKITKTLADAMTYVGDKWNEVYDTYISPFMESLKTGLSDTFGKFLDVYNEYIVPFLDNMAIGIQTLWTEHLQPLVDKIGEFIGSIVSAIQVLWENWIKPLIDWIVANVIPVLVPIFESIWNTISSVFGAIADAIGGIIKTFKGLIDFIVGIFTGDWNKAWEGIKNFFGGIWDAIKGIVEAVWNAIKGTIETVINIIKGIITTAWNAIKTVITNVINGIKSTISTVFNAIKDNISNIWNGILNTISNVWNNIINKVKEGVSGAWNAITSVFGNIAGWFKDKFTQAWQAVKDVFSTGGKIFDGIKEGIINGFKAVVNAIITGINKVIAVPFNAINGILERIKGIEIVGMKPFNWIHTFDVPQIPMLAQGGYVKANQPQLAVIGDNKTQGEIVAPEDKMLQMILTALKMFKDQNRDDDPNNDPDINVNVILDGELIQRQSRKRSDRLALATNGRCS